MILIDVVERDTKRRKHIEIPVSKSEFQLCIRHTEDKKEYLVMEIVVNKIIELQNSLPSSEHIRFENIANYFISMKLVPDSRNGKEDVWSRVENKKDLV